jgi:hypothetical protein
MDPTQSTYTNRADPTTTPHDLTTTAPSTLGGLAAATLAGNTEVDSESATERRKPTIIGMAVGIPMGFIAITLLLYILRRYLIHRASCTGTVYFPPDPINPFATQVFDKAELDTFPNAIAELDGNSVPKELDGFESAATDQRRPISMLSELEGSPGEPSEPTNRTSLSTTLNETRWSNVPSLAPPPAYRAAGTRASIVDSLQSRNPQHPGSGQEVFLTPPRPHASHRLSRPTSGLLPEIELPEGETSLTPKSSGIFSANELGGDNAQTAHEGGQAKEVHKTHEGEPSPNPEIAHGNSAAAQASEEAQAGEEVQAGEMAQESETGNESEDAHTSGTKAQKAEDMQEGEEAREGESTHNGNETPGVDAKAQSEE